MDDFDLRLWNGFIPAGGDPRSAAVVNHVAIDSRRINSSSTIFIALQGGTHDGHSFIYEAVKAGAKYAIVKKGWRGEALLDKTTLLYVESPLAALQEIAACYRSQLPTRIIGIAGSYGKTMVKDLLLAMLSMKYQASASPESFNSQIGAALSLLNLKKGDEFGIIEAGISMAGEMEKLAAMISPDYAISTHIGKKHLSTLGNLQAVADETIKLLCKVPQNSWVLLPDDPLFYPCLPKLHANYSFWNKLCKDEPFALSSEAELTACAPYEILFPDGCKHTGKITAGHSYFINLVNMAARAAWLLGIGSAEICKTLQNFSLQPMRTEFWKSSIGALFINDIYCSDPQSIDKALRHFSFSSPGQKKTFVFGGIRSNHSNLSANYRRIGQAINRIDLDRLILYGQSDFSALIEEVKNQSHIPISVCTDYPSTLNLLEKEITPKDIVLIKGPVKEPCELLMEAFDGSLINNQCVINLAAIQNNLSLIRKKLPPNTRMMMMVKASAYGTNDVFMSKFLQTCGIDIIGVSYVDEGVALKRAGVCQSIFTINAAAYEAKKLVKWGLDVAVSDKSLILAIQEEALKQAKNIKVHLHINTGMGRFGCRPEDALDLAQFINCCPNLILDGIMTHFAAADDPNEDSFTEKQRKSFDIAIDLLKQHGICPPWIHAANSSGAIRFHLPEYNMVRIGLAAYGLYASQASLKALDLQLAISLTSRIAGINTCKKGETISYGRTYTVEKDIQKIAVLPIGYFDGLHRNYSGKSYVVIRGRKAAMVGRICMDFMMVDITDIPGAAVGDTALIFGEDQFGQFVSPEDLACRGNSIVHELITCLGPRIPRIFVYEEAFQIR